jgi:hypothetical protein
MSNPMMPRGAIQTCHITMMHAGPSYRSLTLQQGKLWCFDTSTLQPLFSICKSSGVPNPGVLPRGSGLRPFWSLRLSTPNTQSSEVPNSRSGSLLCTWCSAWVSLLPSATWKICGDDATLTRGTHLSDPIPYTMSQQDTWLSHVLTCGGSVIWSDSTVYFGHVVC